MARDTSSGEPAARRRGPRLMRPYEWTHTDARFAEWLQSQGLSEENWAPPVWATRSSGTGRSD
jgi:hypothetical protein